MRAVLQTGPPEDIEVTRAEHVPRVDVAGLVVEEVIVDEHLVPSSDEIGVDIERDLEVTIHAQETRESAIRGVMEGGAIQRVQRPVAKEVLIHVGRCVGCLEETWRTLCGCTTATAEQTCERYSERIIT